MNEQTNEILVDLRERIARIETKLDQYNEIRSAAYKALEETEDNSEDIEELKENQRWAWRTIFATAVGIIAKVLYDAVRRV